MTKQANLSLIIPAHHEGRLAHHTIRSVLRAHEYANKRSIKIEIIVVMDRPDNKTRSYFENKVPNWFVIKEVDFGDLGLTRNYGVQIAEGENVALLDADDLICKNWFSDIHFFLNEKNDRKTVVHPEFIVVFGTENAIWKHFSSDDGNFKIQNFIENNYWNANCASKKNIFMDFPFQSTTATEGFGYEDWHFNCETLSEGIEHVVIPETVMFIRKKKSGSLLKFTNQTHRTIRPNKLFDAKIFLSQSS